MVNHHRTQEREPRKGSGVRAVVIIPLLRFVGRSRVNTCILDDLSQRCPNIRGSHLVIKKNMVADQANLNGLLRGRVHAHLLSQH